MAVLNSTQCNLFCLEHILLKVAEGTTKKEKLFSTVLEAAREGVEGTVFVPLSRWALLAKLLLIRDCRRAAVVMRVAIALHNMIAQATCHR